MKRSRAKLNTLIDNLLKQALRTEPGDDGATVNQPYLTQLGDILFELIELSHEPDYKGRHGIYYDIRSYTTHENGRPDEAIVRLPDDATPEQVERALETAALNVEDATRTLKLLVTGVRYRREVKEIQP